jgi:hypothetical protein
VVQAREHARFLHERRQNAFALYLGGAAERFRLGNLEHEQSIGAGLAHQPHRADPPFTNGFDQLVALNQLGLRLALLGGRRWCALDGAADRLFEQRGGDGAERCEPHLEQG